MNREVIVIQWITQQDILLPAVGSLVHFEIKGKDVTFSKLRHIQNGKIETVFSDTNFEARTKIRKRHADLLFGADRAGRKPNADHVSLRAPKNMVIGDELVSQDEARSCGNAISVLFENQVNYTRPNSRVNVTNERHE
jgi:hypothetical protein